MMMMMMMIIIIIISKGFLKQFEVKTNGKRARLSVIALSSLKVKKKFCIS